MSGKYATVILQRKAEQTSHVTITPTESGTFRLGSTLQPKDLFIEFCEEAYLNFLVSVDDRRIRMFGPGLSGKVYKMQVKSRTVLLTLGQVEELVSLVLVGQCTPEIIRKESMRLAAMT